MNNTNKFVENVKAFIKKHPKLSVGILIMSLLTLLLSIGATGSVPTIITRPTPTPTPLVQKPFTVTDTSPASNATNVYPGEIQITANTNIPILSQDSFTLNISPKLPYSWEIDNNYPTNTISATILGNLEKNTKYTVTLTGKNNYFYSWSFTTGDEAVESSSNLERIDEDAFIKKDYPLLKDVPYTTPNFSLDYTKELTLQVDITNSQMSTDEIKQSVYTWIKQHDVDPATHTINYVNSYADY